MVKNSASLASYSCFPFAETVWFQFSLQIELRHIITSLGHSLKWEAERPILQKISVREHSQYLGQKLFIVCNIVYDVFITP